MTIKNYTTKVSVNQTIGQIHKLLSKKGARMIMNEYDEHGNITSVAFQLFVKEQAVSFKLPAKPQGVYNVMYGKSRGNNTVARWDQARRTTWRCIYHWIDAQIALVEAGAAEIIEVFLPYAMNGQGETFYETFKENGLKLLT